MIKIPLLAKPLITLAALSGMAVLPNTAAAQNNSGESMYVDLGRWAIYERGRSRNCVLRSGSQGGARIDYFKSGTATAVLNVQSARASVFVGDVTIAFDDAEFPARLVGQATYAPLSNSAAIEAAFRKARTLFVRHGDITVAQLSLQTSSAGFRLLKQCAEEGRIGMMSAPTSRPERSARAPQRNTPPTSRSPAPSIETRSSPPSSAGSAPAASLARNPVPTNRDRWVRDNDYSRFDPGTWGGGVLEFTLVVDARGRTAECIVNASSGSRDFDALTCRNLQRRARFNPALDARGQAALGRYAGSIAYEVLE